MTKNFVCGQEVIIRRLGDGNEEYRARICGIASKHPGNIFYIVEMIDKIPGSEDWTHIVLTDACIDNV